MSTSSDALTRMVFDLLNEADDKPEGLSGPDKILDHPELPMDPSELPVAAVYLSEGEMLADGDTDLVTRRTCEITVEVRAMVKHPVVGTLPFRRWVQRKVLGDQALGRCAVLVEYLGFKPYGGVLDKWLAGALMTFRLTYFWNALED